MKWQTTKEFLTLILRDKEGVKTKLLSRNFRRATLKALWNIYLVEKENKMNSSMNKELAKNVQTVVEDIMKNPFYGDQKKIYDLLIEKVSKHLLDIKGGYQLEYY